MKKADAVPRGARGRVLLAAHGRRAAGPVDVGGVQAGPCFRRDERGVTSLLCRRRRRVEGGLRSAQFDGYVEAPDAPAPKKPPVPPPVPRMLAVPSAREPEPEPEPSSEFEAWDGDPDSIVAAVPAPQPEPEPASAEVRSCLRSDRQLAPVAATAPCARRRSWPRHLRPSARRPSWPRLLLRSSNLRNVLVMEKLVRSRLISWPLSACSAQIMTPRHRRDASWHGGVVSHHSTRPARPHRRRESRGTRLVESRWQASGPAVRQAQGRSYWARADGRRATAPPLRVTAGDAGAVPPCVGAGRRSAVTCR